MEIETIYQNVKHKDVMDRRGPQSHSQDEGKAQKQRGSRCFVWMTVCLGLICVLLLVFITLQLINISYLTEKNLELEGNLTFLNMKLKTDSEHVCFFISRESKTWSESRQYCRDRGADLVIINTEEKQMFISSLVQERAWIGLTDTETEGNMTWVDNSPLNNQTFWFKGEPNSTDGDEDCVELNPGDPVNNWNDLPCLWKIKCICEK